MKPSLLRPLLPQALAAILLSSCSTSIRVPDYQPALHDLGKGTTIRIEADKGFARAIRNEAVKKIETDGYYTHIDTDLAKAGDIGIIIALEQADTFIDSNTYSRTETRTDKHGNEYQDTVYETEYSADGTVSPRGINPKTGKTLFSGSYDTSTGWHSSPETAKKSATKSLASMIVNDITPKEATRKVYIKPTGKNPFIKQSAKACKSGNWDQGLELARQALQLQPENAEANYLMGIIEQRRFNFNEAKRWFSKAATINPEESKYIDALHENDSIAEGTKLYWKQMGKGNLR